MPRSDGAEDPTAETVRRRQLGLAFSLTLVTLTAFSSRTEPSPSIHHGRADSHGSKGARGSTAARFARGIGLFVLVSLPIWIASHLLWAYEGGLNLWPLKNTVELSVVLIVSTVFTVLYAVRWRLDAPWTVYPFVGLAAFAFVLGGFKAANDYLDPPDLLLGLVAQGVAFAYLVSLGPRKSRA